MYAGCGQQAPLDVLTAIPSHSIKTPSNRGYHLFHTDSIGWITEYCKQILPNMLAPPPIVNDMSLSLK